VQACSHVHQLFVPPSLTDRGSAAGSRRLSLYTRASFPDATRFGTAGANQPHRLLGGSRVDWASVPKEKPCYESEERVGSSQRALGSGRHLDDVEGEVCAGVEEKVGHNAGPSSVIERGVDTQEPSGKRALRSTASDMSSHWSACL